jgi:hypothetical protein
MAGRWSNFSGLNIGIDDLQDSINEILRDYGDVVYQATEEGLDAAQKVLIKNLKSESPKKTGEFAKGWKGQKKYRLRRYVGNTTTVLGKKGEKIALANIIEYSTTRGKPFIKSTYQNSINEMATAVVNTIKREV